MKKIFFLLCLIGSTTAYSQNKRVTEKHLNQLYQWMSGDFSSGAQAAADTNYFHILLRMKPFKMAGTTGKWLYVEQAVAAAEQKPYRQRVYHVYQYDDTTLASKVYEIRQPKAFIGAWKAGNDSILGKLTTDSLIDRQGCAIFLHTADGKSYSGSTPGHDCLSSLRGATYATSEVTITSKRVVSWDRGWNAAGTQVWGAVKGGYQFLKKRRIR
ncbi:MAG: chromophore lyase CpcT/CpeT [Chitinophagales bacterium]